MLDAMYIGATGMYAGQKQIEIISNNIANMNTPAFKKQIISFEDLMYRPIDSPYANKKDETMAVGQGVTNTAISKSFTLGELKPTQNINDVAIDGNGFFEVILPDGNLAYTRVGGISHDADGYLVTANGYRYSSLLQVPPDASTPVISNDGEVMVQVKGQAEPLSLGFIELAHFMNVEQLDAMGGNLYISNERTGEAYYGAPGENEFGQIRQGWQESSNVDMSQELMQLMLAQRTFEVNAKVVQVGDQFMKVINELAN